MLHMFVYPYLASFPSLSLACFPFCLFLFVFACTHMKWGRLEQGHDFQGTSKKGKDASPQRAMISRLGGLAPLERSSPSLSLSPFSKACIWVPIHVPPFIFLLLAWAVFPRYGNVYFTFPVPCWAIPLERWQCLVYFLALCGSIVHDACIYIYISSCLCMGGCALCMMDSRGYVSDSL